MVNFLSIGIFFLSKKFVNVFLKICSNLFKGSFSSSLPALLLCLFCCLFASDSFLFRLKKMFPVVLTTVLVLSASLLFQRLKQFLCLIKSMVSFVSSLLMFLVESFTDICDIPFWVVRKNFLGWICCDSETQCCESKSKVHGISRFSETETLI